MASYTVGVDVGGTKILAALVAEGESVGARAKVPCPQDSSESLMAALKGAVREVMAEGQVGAIGVGVPGVVGANGECIWAPNAPLSQVPVAAILREEFGVPVAVGNDVNVGTLGEKTFGAAREYENVFGMFVGTGIGGGLVINGQVVVGDHCLGAEVGHIIVDFEAARRGDEGKGEFEYYASRLGIERMILDAIAAGRKTVAAEKLGKGSERIKSGLLKKGLDAGDDVVVEAVENAAEIIGLATVTVIHLCDPEAIVYGGGVIEACGDYMLPRIEKTIKEHVAPGNGKPIRILRSQLGDDAVLLGAAALARGLVVIREPSRVYPVVKVKDFGSVVVDGETLDYDIVVRHDGSVRKRKKKLSRQVHGTAHEVSVDEIRWVCNGKPDQLFVGQGFHSNLTLSREAAAWLDKKGIECTLAPTPEAAVAFNAAGGNKALLLHTTC